jgi:hypothetical protein
MSDPVIQPPDGPRLVGLFLQSFALLEMAIDAGIGKLLNLDSQQNDIVCSSIPFAKKLGVFFTAEGLLSTLPDNIRKSKLKDTRSSIHGLNQKRVMFAHNPFATTSTGVEFRRVVADTKLDVSMVSLTSSEVHALCRKCITIAGELDTLVATMEPYAPSADFRDPRNSQYLVGLL